MTSQKEIDEYRIMKEAYNQAFDLLAPYYTEAESEKIQ